MPPESNLAIWRRAPRQAAHLLIRAYQLSLSAFIGRTCRHEPSCSAYMDEAIQRHGLWTGGLLGTARLCRCHPWGTWGYDPVPDTVTPLRQRVHHAFASHRRSGGFRCERQASPEDPRV